MPLYVYKARDKSGNPEKGTIEVQSEDAAVEALFERDLILTKLTPKEKVFDWERVKKGSSRVTLNMLMVFTKQFAVMINAGMSVTESLKTLADEEINKNFGDIIQDVAQSVEGGTTISEAMEKYPKVFSKIYINLIKVGEASGKLDVVLTKAADKLEKDYELRVKVKSAMIYPAFIFTTLIAISLLLVTFVIPRLTPILKGAGAELPFSTNLLIVISNAFLKFWWLLIPFIIISSGGLFTYFKRTVEGNRVWDGIKLRIPIAGKIIRNIYMARFTRTFSTLIDGGVNVIDALEITADSIGNVHYEKDLLNISKEVKNGSSLADSFRKSHHVSRVVKKMMKVGETTGTLDTTIGKLADFYEAEVEDSINNLSKTLEPVLIVIMGVGVAFVVSSVIMPLYDATRSLGSN